MSYLHVRLVEAVGLPSTDLLGFADPYCKVFLKNVTHLSENKVFKSEAKKKSTDPIFDCAASLQVSSKDFANGILTIDIYDHDKAKKTDDELGTASLPLSYFADKKQFQGWLPIRSATHISNKHNKHKHKHHKHQHKQEYKQSDDNTKSPIAINESGTSYVQAKDDILLIADIKDKNKYKEQTPEIQFLNGNQDINAPPPQFPQIQNNNSRHTPVDSIGSNDFPLDSYNSIKINTSLRVGSPSEKYNKYSPINIDKSNDNKQNKSNINQSSSNNKQKKLAMLTEEYMKRREDELQIARNETFTAAGINMNTQKKNIKKTNTIDAVNIKKLEKQKEEETLFDVNATPGHSATLQHGRRNRDSGRIFIVVHYQRNFHFGKMSTTDVKTSRIKNLKIINKFEQTIPFNVFSLTFNCGNCILSDLNDSLSEWLPNNGHIDLYALAFQELNEKHHNQNKEEKDNEEEKENLDTNQQTEIENYFLNHLNKNDINKNINNYITIAHYKMWQTRIFLFCQSKFEHKISNVTTHFHTTGIGGIFKNKGGVAISLDFDGVSLCFVSCHLAAHQTKMKNRNTMYKKLCKHIKVGWPKQPLLGQFHFIFFMGDMNYRVNYFGEAQHDKPTDETFQQVCQIIKQITNASSKQQMEERKKNIDKKQITGGGKLLFTNAYAGLLKYDQLNIARENRKAFVDFHEHHIKFPPSFKVKRQIGIHYISQRLPAWCDRILWKCPKSFDECNEYKAKNYRVYDKVNVSDHKPVSCSFILPTWNRPCGISDDCTKSIVHFRNVSAQNLIPSDVNGKSDPFIHFPRQLILEKYIQSKRVNKTLNPKWKNKHLKPLMMIRNSLPFLQKALLLFQIRDHDKFTANDLIGCGYIELKQCVNNLNKWCKFKQYLTLSGKDAGIFMGEIKLEYKIKSKKK